MPGHAPQSAKVRSGWDRPVVAEIELAAGDRPLDLHRAVPRVLALELVATMLAIDVPPTPTWIMTCPQGYSRARLGRYRFFLALADGAGARGLPGRLITG